MEMCFPKHEKCYTSQRHPGLSTETSVDVGLPSGNQTSWKIPDLNEGFNRRIIELNGGSPIATFGWATGYIGFPSFPRINPHEDTVMTATGLNFGTCAGTRQG